MIFSSGSPISWTFHSTHHLPKGDDDDDYDDDDDDDDLYIIGAVSISHVTKK